MPYDDPILKELGGYFKAEEPERRECVEAWASVHRETSRATHAQRRCSHSGKDVSHVFNKTCRCGILSTKQGEPE